LFKAQDFLVFTTVNINSLNTDIRTLYQRFTIRLLHKILYN